MSKLWKKIYALLIIGPNWPFWYLKDTTLTASFLFPQANIHYFDKFIISKSRRQGIPPYTVFGIFTTFQNKFWRDLEILVGP